MNHPNRAKFLGAALATAVALSTLAGTATATADPAASATSATSAESEPDNRPAAGPRYKILKHLDYSGPGKASLRLGYYNASADRGFGWKKVKYKHNIRKYGAVEYIAKSPHRAHIGGQSYRLKGYAGKYYCRNGRCRLVKQYKVLLTVNQKRLRDGHDKGVITQYCVGVTRCPNWVTKALARANRRTAASQDGRRLGRGYRPLAHSVPASAAAAG